MDFTEDLAVYKSELDTGEEENDEDISQGLFHRLWLREKEKLDLVLQVPSDIYIDANKIF